MIEKLISRSKIARDEFYNFVYEEIEEAEIEIEDEQEEKSKETEKKITKAKSGNIKKSKSNPKLARLENWGKSNDTRFEVKNKNLMGILMRVQQDCLLFLSTNPT